MPGMSGALMVHMMGGGMMDSMRAHLTMIDRLSADRMKAMMPAHRARITRLLRAHRDMMSKAKS
jgi:hypothetical protein